MGAACEPEPARPGTVCQSDGHAEVILRASPHGTIVAKIPNGQDVQILEERDCHLKVMWGSTEGWAKSENVQQRNPHVIPTLEGQPDLSRHVSALSAPEPARVSFSDKQEDVRRGMSAPTLVGQRQPARYSFSDINDLVRFAEDCQIRFLDQQYIVTLSKKGGRFCRRQEVPSLAFIANRHVRKLCVLRISGPQMPGTTPEVQEVAGIIVVSHSWLSAEHPDPDGLHLKQLAEILMMREREEKKTALNFSSDYLQKFELPRIHAAVFMDYPCLPQLPRSSEESQSFRLAVDNLQIVYGSDQTEVVRLLDVPKDAFNSVPYEKRGWCDFETRVSVTKDRVADKFVFSVGGDGCALGTPIPMVPDRYEKHLQTLHFTSPKTDVSVVLNMYNNVFTQRIMPIRKLKFSNRSFDDFDLILELLPYCQCLEELWLTESKDLLANVERAQMLVKSLIESGWGKMHQTGKPASVIYRILNFEGNDMSMAILQEFTPLAAATAIICGYVRSSDQPGLSLGRGSIHVRPHLYLKKGGKLANQAVIERDTGHAVNESDDASFRFRRQGSKEFTSEPFGFFHTLFLIEPDVSYTPYTPCFAGISAVLRMDGQRRLVWEIQGGDIVWTPDGAAKVLCVVRTECAGGRQSLCSINGSAPIFTPNHPIRLKGDWHLPQALADVETVSCPYVFNFVLSRGHIIDINGVQCATLGHNFAGDIISHPYLGTDRVVQDLARDPGWAKGLVCRKAPQHLEQHAEGLRQQGLQQQFKLVRDLASKEDLELNVSSALLQKIHSAALTPCGVPSSQRSKGSHMLRIGHQHLPPNPDLVQLLVQQFCGQTSAALRISHDACEVGAFCLWWVAAVHPFEDGNGRAARGLAALVVSRLQNGTTNHSSADAILQRLNDAFRGKLRDRLCTALQHINEAAGMCECCGEGHWTTCGINGVSVARPLASILTESNVW